jgi:hypothetical protein
MLVDQATTLMYMLMVVLAPIFAVKNLLLLSLLKESQEDQD